MFQAEAETRCEQGRIAPVQRLAERRGGQQKIGRVVRCLLDDVPVLAKMFQ